MTIYTPAHLRRIDAQVARLLGFKQPTDFEPHFYRHWPHYTTDIVEAWRCIDYMRERGNPSQMQTFQAEILRQVRAGRRFLPVAWLLHLTPLAICLAFLAANGVDAAP